MRHSQALLRGGLAVVMCGSILLLGGCHRQQESAVQSSAADEPIESGESRIIEEPAETRSPMEIPDWYLELLKEHPREARQVVGESSNQVRGYW